jgi:hypothetical protein
MSTMNLSVRLKDIFEEFFTVVSKEYSLDKKVVRDVCLRCHEVRGLKSEVTKPVKPLTKKESVLFEQAKEFIASETPAGKLTVDKLKEMCRVKGLKVSGKKDELLHRLENPTAAESKAGTTRKKKSLFKPRDVTKIIEKLRGNISSLSVRKNSQGHYVHLESGLVFDPRSQKVIGKWKDDQVKWLAKNDVEMCIKLGVMYELPENLDLGIVKVVDKKLEEVLGEDDFKDVSDDEESDEEGGEDE